MKKSSKIKKRVDLQRKRRLARDLRQLHRERVLLETEPPPWWWTPERSR